MEKFKFATKNGLRFNYKGMLSVEDLWQLSLENLDMIYGNLMKEKKTVNEDSLLNSRTKDDKVLDIRIDIVKDIVETKLDEKREKEEAKENKEKKQKIMEIIARKEDTELEGKSIEDLKKML